MLIITGIVRLGQGEDITAFILIFKFFELLRTREFASFFGVRDSSTVLSYIFTLTKIGSLFPKGPQHNDLITSSSH